MSVWLTPVAKLAALPAAFVNGAKGRHHRSCLCLVMKAGEHEFRNPAESCMPRVNFNGRTSACRHVPADRYPITT
jgi:hypothetical protein